MEPTKNVNPAASDIEAFRQQPDDDAIIMLNLLRFNGEEGRRRYSEYAKVSGQEISERGGRVIYSGGNIVPQSAPWDSVAIRVETHGCLCKTPKRIRPPLKIGRLDCLLDCCMRFGHPQDCSLSMTFHRMMIVRLRWSIYCDIAVMKGKLNTSGMARLRPD